MKSQEDVRGIICQQDVSSIICQQDVRKIICQQRCTQYNISTSMYGG